MADLKPGSAAWVDAIVAYTRKTRPDCASMMESFALSHKRARYPHAILLMRLAFEAGRTFQQKNPDLELGPIDPGTIFNPID